MRGVSVDDNHMPENKSASRYCYGNPFIREIVPLSSSQFAATFDSNYRRPKKWVTLESNMQLQRLAAQPQSAVAAAATAAANWAPDAEHGRQVLDC